MPLLSLLPDIATVLYCGAVLRRQKNGLDIGQIANEYEYVVSWDGMRRISCYHNTTINSAPFLSLPDVANVS